ncbi:MAG: signal peptidase I [Coprococcus sp.]
MSENNKVSIKAEIFSWIKVILSAVIIAFIVDSFIIANAVVPTGSMETTIPAGSRIMGFRLYYYFAEPERGDIVIFKYPDDEKIDYLKRIIGLPGETVEIIRGRVYIDGELLEEPYLSEEPTGDFGPYEVPEGCYFMLGDNRAVSKDARYWENTYVSRDKIIAKAFFMYYPSLRWLDN